MKQLNRLLLSLALCSSLFATHSLADEKSQPSNLCVGLLLFSSLVAGSILAVNIPERQPQQVRIKYESKGEAWEQSFPITRELSDFDENKNAYEEDEQESNLPNNTSPLENAASQTEF